MTHQRSGASSTGPGESDPWVPPAGPGAPPRDPSPEAETSPAERRRKWRRWAIGLGALGAGVLVVWIGIAGLTPPSYPGAAPDGASAQPPKRQATSEAFPEAERTPLPVDVSLAELTAGDCVESLDDQARTADLTYCDEPHQAEVVAIITARSNVRTEAGSQWSADCDKVFRQRVYDWQLPEPILTYRLTPPSPAEWDGGARKAICAIEMRAGDPLLVPMTPPLIDGKSGEAGWLAPGPNRARPGDCFRDWRRFMTGAEGPTACDVPHMWQITAVKALRTATASGLEDQSYRLCSEALDALPLTYSQRSGAMAIWYHPTPEQVAKGNNALICGIYPADDVQWRGDALEGEFPD